MVSKVKAAVMTEPGKIEIREFPYPKVADDCIVAKIRMAAICGTDLHLFRGRDENLNLPIIMGHENLAEVVEIGDKARTEIEATGKTLSPGDRIVFYPGYSCGECWYCRNLPAERYGVLCSNGDAYGITLGCSEPPHLFGGYAEYVYLVSRVPVYKVPDDIPDEVAVLTDIFASAAGVLKTMAPYPALKEGFGPTGFVVVQGAGPIGLAAAVTARMCGAYKIILVGGPRHRLEIAEKLGIIDYTINIDEVTDPQERVRLVKDLTPSGVGSDLVVEAAGVAEAVPEGLEMLRRGGTFLESGSFANTGEVAINPFKHLCYKDVYLLGHYGSPPSSYLTALRMIELAWRERHIPLDLLVTDRYPLEKTQEALESKLQYAGLKTIIEP